MFGEYAIKAGYALIFLSWMLFSLITAYKRTIPLANVADYLQFASKTILYLIISAPLLLLTIVLGTVAIDFFLAFLAYLISKLRPLFFKKRIALEELWEDKRDAVVTDINNLSVGIRDRIKQHSQHSNYEFLKNYQKLEPEIGQDFIDYYESNSNKTPK